MRKSDRLFQLTNILRKHQPITAKALAEKLDVSERTVYRYIDDLSVAGIPVYGEAGIGYRLSEGFELPPLQLSPLESEALVLGVNMVSAWSGKSMSEAARSVLHKIEATLPNSANTGDEPERFIRTPNCHAMMDNHIWDVIYTALSHKRCLQLEYRSLADVESMRDIRPLGIFFWGGVWTLTAWCYLRNDYRDFRLDHIQRASFLEQDLTLPGEVSLAAYIELQRLKAEREGD